MTHTVRSFCLAGSLAFVSTIAVAPHAGAQSTPSTTAYVYVQIQGPQGSVYGFTATSAGKLTAISGAPWKPTGQIVGATSSKFFTIGHAVLHSYGIDSSGAIGSQLEQNPYTDFSGGSCGSGANSLNSAVLDHSGVVLYTLLQNGGSASCATYQSFAIDSQGAFDGLGDTQVNTAGGASVGLPSILGKESFAYADFISGHASSVIGFERGSSGLLQLMQFHETDPTLKGGANYIPYRPDASPTGNYVVLQLFPYGSNPPQLGSYTVDSEGNLTTTNTSANMPASSLDGPYSTFSPSGNLFVLYADNGVGNPGNGIEIYNFNGAAPLTLNKALLTGTPIDQVVWDSTNHMYAISEKTNKLYVFTVTPTSVIQDTAWSIGSPYRMIVVSRSGASAATTQYSTTLLSQTGTYGVDGQVTIDTLGNTTISATGLTASHSYNVQFCPAADAGLVKTMPPCFAVTSFSTNSSGEASSAVKFPKAGYFAGDFLVNDASTGTPASQSGLGVGVANQTFMAMLLPETEVNGGVLTSTKTQDPLTSGTISYTSGSALFTLKGTSPNTNFGPVETEGVATYSSNTYTLPSFTTDASGNGAENVNLNSNGEGGDIFEVEGGSGAGFVGGFSIP